MMINKWVSGLACIFMLGCELTAENSLSEGPWLAHLVVMDDKLLPFTFTMDHTDNGFIMKAYNADEVLTIDEIYIDGDSIMIRMPVFEGYISGTFTKNQINGKFIKESLGREVPFHASYGDVPRFSNTRTANVDISGVWETTFNPKTRESYAGKGIFTQKHGKVTGTFRTPTGDYRYLEGVVDGDILELSTFDGAHAYLFTAHATDSTLNGTFYSGNHSREFFTARRNEGFTLPDENSLTFIKEGYGKFQFSFPDAQGNLISLSDPEFRNKVVIVQVMGTWCPNCLDETKFLASYLEKEQQPGLEVVALAFEYAKTREDAFKGIQRLRDRIRVNYPILLAQYGSSDKTEANKKLPMLNHVMSYPTTIFVDKKGEVRRILTGFNGPATGEKYESFKREFSDFINSLLAE